MARRKPDPRGRDAYNERGEFEFRARLPKGEEMFGIVEQRLGCSKMYVRCADEKIRICRIPGRFSRRLWVREGDLIILEPWSVQGYKKADVVYRYTPAQKDWLVQHRRLPEGLM
ncbi:MAG: translation initiation factor eIF-1A [Candidatus Altiarchaeota archaeon]|nr:translation initiation factor eIF-1A [Candidatus Altiarchaeota archaeon]